MLLLLIGWRIRTQDEKSGWKPYANSASRHRNIMQCTTGRCPYFNFAQCTAFTVWQKIIFGTILLSCALYHNAAFRCQKMKDGIYFALSPDFEHRPGISVK